MSSKPRTRRISILFVLSLLVSISLAEAKTPWLPAPDPERGGIAVTVRGRFALGQKVSAVQVYLVRLGQDVDIYSAESVVLTSFSKKKQVYLLNARPGRYVAVAAQLGILANFGGETIVFFDRATILRTEVEVTPGRIAFMGDLLVDLKREMDVVQTHYLRLVARGASRMGFQMYGGDLIELDRTVATETAFWELARVEVFNGAPEWRARFKP